MARAFDYVKESGAQALIFITDNLMFGRRKEIAALALSHHLPSIHSFPPEVQDGGLMSYGPNERENYRLAHLPVEEPTRFSLHVNLKTAKALEITIPSTVLFLADKVIE